MPELPEVETLVRTLRPALAGRTILSADLRWPGSLETPSPARFKKQAWGEPILGLSRRAKFFDLQSASFHLVIHLRMSGDLQVAPGPYTAGKHDRLVLELSDGRVFIFTDPRKFGRIWLVEDPAPLYAELGPEPFSKEFTAAWLFAALQRRNRQLKPLLLDQKFLAGLGNIYTDEALHRARLHPLTLSRAVTEEQARALWRGIRATLQEGIRRNGASIDWVYRGGEFQNHFRVYGRTGEACPACGDTIQRITTGQRGTHFCPTCQENPLK